MRILTCVAWAWRACAQVGIFGQKGVAYATVLITALTLFLGEILPKSLAVAQPERLARATLPVINAISFLLTPLSAITSFLNDRLLGMLGVSESESSEAVTQPELRMVLSGASQVCAWHARACPPCMYAHVHPSCVWHVRRCAWCCRAPRSRAPSRTTSRT